ncbi:MAG: hypothetical protein ACKV22_40755 [Bryobacteraceae bacterium]
MTANKLYAILHFVQTLDGQARLQSGLDGIRENLEQLVQTPANPQHQSTLATSLKSFEQAADKLQDAITPSIAGSIADMGGGEFFDPAIAEKVKTSISQNAMTPSVARDFVQDLASRRSTFLQTVRNTLLGLERLNIKQSQLVPGHADVSFMIPRELFENDLGALAKEMVFISRLIQDVSEGVTGTQEKAQLESLSSSIPTISVEASAAVLNIIAKVVSLFLDSWEKIKKIRRIRDDLADIGIKGAPEEELNEHVTMTVEEIVEESTDLVLASYKGESGRKNELHNAVATDVRRLFGQIERGLTVEFRAEPKPNEDGDEGKALGNIIELSRDMKFPPPAKEPLLLVQAEILEGELHKRTYKKTTTTTTTTKTAKKETKKEPAGGKE